MSITEIKTEIAQLPEPNLAQWLEELQADAWDRQIERDVKAGRFEAIFKRVDEQVEARQRKRARQVAPPTSARFHSTLARQKRNSVSAK